MQRDLTNMGNRQLGRSEEFSQPLLVNRGSVTALGLALERLGVSWETEASSRTVSRVLAWLKYASDRFRRRVWEYHGHILGDISGEPASALLGLESVWE